MKSSKAKQSKPGKSDKGVEEDLLLELQRLRAENAYLKKLQALVQKRIAHENGRNAQSSRG